MTFKHLCRFALCGLTAVGGVCAEEAQLQWHASAGMNRYTESKMSLQGPELGLHAQLSRLALVPSWQLSGEVLLGSQHYSSQGTGTMDHVRNIESRWHALAPVAQDPQNGQGLSMGLGVHTLWNNLSGLSSTLNPGYERQAVQLWLPMQWQSAQHWNLEMGVLLRGLHTSRLSQTNPAYSDVLNIQKHGTYLQADWDFAQLRGHALGAYARYTHLSASNSVVMGGAQWVEPESQRWQMGLNLQWSGH